MSRPTEPKIRLRGEVWHYFFTIGGKRVRGSTGERDRASAESFLAAKWYEAHKAARLPVAAGPAARLDLAGIASLWLSSLEGRASERNPRYAERHENDVKHLLRVFSLPSDVTNDAWQEAMRELRGEGLSWASLRHMTITLRHVMRFAVSLQAVTAAPELRPPPNKLIAKTEKKRRALSAVDRDRVLRALRAGGDDRAARIWQAMAYSGLRRNELARLTLRWLDEKADVLHVPASASKAGEDEVIYLHPKFRQAVREEAAAREINDPDVPVFGGFDVRKAFARALKISKVDGTGITAHHGARHTFGTILAQMSGGDVSAVMAGGRWRSLAMAQRYVHASAARAKAAMKRL